MQAPRERKHKVWLEAFSKLEDSPLLTRWPVASEAGRHDARRLSEEAKLFARALWRGAERRHFVAHGL
jgi:hypothetical protein